MKCGDKKITFGLFMKHDIILQCVNNLPFSDIGKIKITLKTSNVHPTLHELR